MKTTGTLLALAVLNLACFTPTETASFADTAQLRLDVAVSRTELAPGDSLTITVTARNLSSQAVLLPESPCMPLTYRIFGPDGRRVAPPASLRCAVAGGQAQYLVAPGAVAGVTHRWAAVEGYGDVHSNGAPLQPGEYVIVGGVHGEPELRSVTAGVRITVR